ncbi:MAG: AMP-binding protein [Streptosporangiales bacterium]|nr:AMP-binding protein [Streptosporangiales bacterium]
MADVEVRGLRLRTWKHAKPTLRHAVADARAFGDRDFLVYGEERVTHGEHADLVATLARRLIEEYGVRKGDRVAIAMRNHPEWSVAFFAAACAGAIVVPLNAWWTAPELEYGLRDSGSRVLIADQQRLDRLRDVLPGLGIGVMVARPDGPVPDGVRDLAAVIGEVTPGEPLPEVSLHPDDDATIFYTSGTTGKPKGAVGTHRNICVNPVSRLYSGARARLRAGGSLSDPPPVDRNVWLLTVPLFHATGAHSVLLPALLAGDALVIMYKWDAGKALELVERERVTGFTCVPTMLLQFLAHPDFDRYDVSSLAGVSSGGAPAPAALADRLAEQLPGRSPGNGYGLTETSSVATTNAGVDYTLKAGSVGLPVAICDTKVVDAEGKELPAGEVGELWIKGTNVVMGYWNKPEATAAAITDGWLHTGDLARMDDDGFIFIVDRAKDMVLRGGENVYCAEVEAALYEHPDVLECAVIGVPHAELGEEVGAVVRPVPGSALEAEALTTFLTGRIAKFKIPAHIWFRPDELPRNAAGKILKPELRATLSGSAGG